MCSIALVPGFFPQNTHTHAHTHTQKQNNQKKTDRCCIPAPSTLLFTCTQFLQGYANGVPPLNTVTVLGVQGTPTQAKLNGQTITGFSFDPSTSSLTLTDLKAPMGEQFTITWGAAAAREEL